MGGRAWYFGAVRLDLTIRSPQQLDYWQMLEYIGGVMDTLDGSSGIYFTYLPTVYEDDCQVSIGHTRHELSREESYELRITFL